MIAHGGAPTAWGKYHTTFFDAYQKLVERGKPWGRRPRLGPNGEALSGDPGLEFVDKGHAEMMDMGKWEEWLKYVGPGTDDHGASEKKLDEKQYWISAIGPNH